MEEGITFEGWAEQVRFASKGKIAFVDLYRVGKHGKKLQVVISSDSKDDIKALGLSRHCALRVKGKIVTSQGSEQGTELQTTPDQVEVLGKCDPDEYPIPKKDLTLDYLRSVPTYRARTNLFRAVFVIRDLVTRSIHDFFEPMGYIHVHTPLITKSDCEGAGETFQVVAPGCPDFFGSSTGYLTVSGQLQGEVLASALGPIYTFGPTFRAEKSTTTRHLSEFIMMEPEIPFIKLSDLIEISVYMLKYIVQYVMDKGLSYLKVLDKHSPGLITKLERFCSEEPVIMTYTDAIEKLVSSEKQFGEKPVWGIDLNSDHETWLCGDSLTVLTDYPKDIKAFYMYENDDKKTVACMDVLLPEIGEVIGGSQRESRLDVLEPKMEKLGLGGPEYDFYRDLRKFGYAGSSGFGLGFERMVRYVTGMKNIRDVVPFPVSYGKIHI